MLTISADLEKRGQSGYNVYFSEQMKKMRAEDKVTRPSDLTKIIGKNWSALSEVEKVRTFDPARFRWPDDAPLARPPTSPSNAEASHFSPCGVTM